MLRLWSTGIEYFLERDWCSGKQTGSQLYEKEYKKKKKKKNSFPIFNIAAKSPLYVRIPNAFIRLKFNE